MRARSETQIGEKGRAAGGRFLSFPIRSLRLESRDDDLCRVLPQNPIAIPRGDARV